MRKFEVREGIIDGKLDITEMISTSDFVMRGVRQEEAFMTSVILLRLIVDLKLKNFDFHVDDKGNVHFPIWVILEILESDQ